MSVGCRCRRKGRCWCRGQPRTACRSNGNCDHIGQVSRPFKFGKVVYFRSGCGDLAHTRFSIAHPFGGPNRKSFLPEGCPAFRHGLTMSVRGRKADFQKFAASDHSQK